MSATNKILVIFGPTAAGKTGLGIEFAKEFSARGGGELVSADSRQVYRYMDIGSGKLTLSRKAEDEDTRRVSGPPSGVGERERTIEQGDGYWIQDGITVWGYDIVTPDVTYTAADFQQFARNKLKDILNRGKIPILVGGTGFYISAVLGEVEIPRVPPNPKLREKLSKFSASELYSRLKKLDLKRAKTIQKENPRRLIRAIEIAEWRWEVRDGKLDNDIRNERVSHLPLQSPEGANLVPHTPRSTSTLLVGLTAPRRFLYERIDKRAELMVEAGLIDEIKDLLNKGYGWELSAMSGIGYRQFRPYFEEGASLDKCVERLKYDTHAYARRQQSYLKRFKDARTFDISIANFDTEAKDHVESWLGSGG